METRVNALKNNFNNISVIRNNVKDIFEFLQSRINKLKFFYSEFIKTNKTELFIFGLDSFHFQSKLIDIEYDDMKRLFLAINNRMYCEYFKLYKIIIEYVYENIQNDNLNFYKKMINYFSPEKTKKYLVKNCSINLEKGKSLAIIGLNGAGKSTLMKIISGVISPSEGEIKILNYTPYNRNKLFLKKIGVVFGHKSSLLWDIPLKFSLELHKTIYQIDDSSYQSRLNYLTEVLSLKECLNKKVKFMSLGERVKSDLLMNMIHNPELILLDEPTIGVDMESKIKIREFINNEKENNNCTFILTSHDPADIENCCDKINILSKGEIVFSEETNVLKNKYNEKVKIILKKVDKNYEYSKKELIQKN